MQVDIGLNKKSSNCLTLTIFRADNLITTDYISFYELCIYKCNNKY